MLPSQNDTTCLKQCKSDRKNVKRHDKRASTDPASNGDFLNIFSGKQKDQYMKMLDEQAKLGNQSEKLFLSTRLAHQTILLTGFVKVLFGPVQLVIFTSI